MKNIEYNLKSIYKISIFDMSIDITICGYIVYRKKKYNIKTVKTHNGPKFIFEYYMIINNKNNITKILDQISEKLIHIISDDIMKSNGKINQWKGCIEYDEKQN